MDTFEAAGYGDDELRESPIAAKLNGYAAGHDVAVAEEFPPEREVTPIEITPYHPTSLTNRHVM